MAEIIPGNLFDEIPADMPEELSETLSAGKDVRIERIVSRGHRSEENFWYDQADDEWVVILTGWAELRFDGHDDTILMTPGDWIHIPAHKRHRVEATADDEDSIWLAVFFRES